MSNDILKRLSETIGARASAPADASYTRTLLDGGPQVCAQKFAEEAAETVIAAVAQDAEALRNEAADTLYHLLVLLQVRGVAFDEVLAELERRSARSGLEEKASRGRK